MRGNFLYYFLWGVFCTKLLLFVYFCIKLYIYVDKLLAFSPYLLLFIKFCIYGLYIFVVINCTFRPLAIPPCSLCYLEFCPLPFRTPPCVILNAVKNLFQILRSAQDDGRIFASPMTVGFFAPCQPELLPLAIPNVALCYLEFCPMLFRTSPLSFRTSPLSFRTPPCVILNAVKNLFQILRSAQDDGRIFASPMTVGFSLCRALKQKASPAKGKLL